MLSESLIYLIDKRRGVQLHLWGWILLLYGVPCLLIGSTYVAIAALAVMTLVPLYFFMTETTLLHRLRRGRCLEEMFSAGMRPESLVDTLAFYGAVPVMQVCLRIWPCLLVGVVLGDHYRWFALVAVWPLGVLGIFVWGVYLYLALSVRWAWLLVALCLEAAVATVVATPLERVLLFLGVVAVARQSAIRALICSDQRVRRVRRRRPGWKWSDNLIVARESARRGRGGWATYLLWLVVLPTCLGRYLSQGPAYEWFDRWEIAVAFLGVLLFWRSAMSTVGAIVGEKARKTWEVLAQVGVPFADYRRGWLLVAAVPGWLASAPCLLLLVAAGVAEMPFIIIPILTGPPSCLILIWLTWVGAHVGLAISACTRNLAEAYVSLLAGFLGGFSILLACAGLFRNSNFNSCEGAFICRYLFPLAALLIVLAMAVNWAQDVLEVHLLESSLPPTRRLLRGWYWAGVPLLASLAACLAALFEAPHQRTSLY